MFQVGARARAARRRRRRQCAVTRTRALPGAAACNFRVDRGTRGWSRGALQQLLGHYDAEECGAAAVERGGRPRRRRTRSVGARQRLILSRDPGRCRCAFRAQAQCGRRTGASPPWFRRRVRAPGPRRAAQTTKPRRERRPRDSLGERREPRGPAAAARSDGAGQLEGAATSAHARC